MPEIRHGETAGWVAGCRESCCREAIYAYNRKWKSDVSIYGEDGRRRVDAIGSQRRLQATFLEGWFAEEIAAVGGWTSGQAVRNLLARETVSRETAERVSAACKALHDRWLHGALRNAPDAGLRRRSIEAGKRKGWLPGAVWDDIDDPTEKPQGLAS